MSSGPTSTRSLALLAAVLAVASTASGQGTIVYHQPDTPVSFAPVPGFDFRPVDLNGDGYADFTFDSTSFTSTELDPQLGNRVLMLPEPPPDLGGYVEPLPVGIEISADSAQGGLVWYDGSGPFGGATLSACASPFGCVGPWLGQTAYAGVELRFNGQSYYGWLRIAHFEFSNGGTLLDWAYETRPDTPILAGAVPEPSAFTLFAVGSIAIWFVRQKKRS